MPTTAASHARTLIRQRHRLPAVRRVREVLRLQIGAERFVDGTLPGESSLAAEYGVSRSVVREALDLLREEGLIARLQGAGTFVVAPERSHHSIEVLQGLPEGIERGRTRVAWTVLALEELPAPAVVADRLGVAPGDDVVHLERLTTLDGAPLMLRSSWFPADVGGHLFAPDTELTASMYDVLDAVGAVAVHSELRVEAGLADASTAPALGLDVGAPLLVLERAVHGSDGRVIELGLGRARGDRFSLTTVLRRIDPSPTPETTTAHSDPSPDPFTILPHQGDLHHDADR
ncbi:MAG: GntR family transcriptional regulator [Acidimicrobiales bacterium]